MGDNDFESIKEATARALAQVGIQDEDAEQLLADQSVMAELRAAYSRIHESRSMAADARSTLGAALRSEGISEADLDEMMKDIDDGGSGAGGDDAHENVNDHFAAKVLEEVNAADQRDFDHLVQQLGGAAASSASNDSNNVSSSRSTAGVVVTARLLPVLPLVAEYCGAMPTLFGLCATASRWRQLLLSPSRCIQRTLWIAVAVTEFPIEVSELGEDALLTVQCWSDVVREMAIKRLRAVASKMSSQSS